ncbi:hypothetical protein F5884DRAFT_117849 [Xylogone sp. PMI_703]|nr:hypothetical protein F5884DRAFT_117849 [Xylogone sp. PMI_703]
MSKVLLTGGSGFVASHVLDSLLQSGFHVVVTVRSEDKGRKILAAYPRVTRDQLSYVIVRDIVEEGAFDNAVKTEPPFQFVIHTASPYHFNIQDPVKDFLDPAIKGTTGILKSVKAYAPTVKRVVITSSSAAIINPGNHPKVYDETIWGVTTWEQALDPRLTYRASKIYAEKAAWDFVKNEKPNFDLVTINPPLIFGPTPIHLSSLDDLNTSNHRIRDMIQGKSKDVLPPTGPIFIFADARDAAQAHVRAIEVPEAGGHRFFVVGGYFSNKKIADVIRESHPELASKLPSKDAPDDMPAEIYGIDNSKSRKILGLSYRDLKTSVDDAVKSMLELGA